MAQIELSSLVGLTQSYIAKNYATALIDKSKTAELKAYIGKYLYDTGYSVAGYDTKGLVQCRILRVHYRTRIARSNRVYTFRPKSSSS